ncbi:MAG: helix-turn-helix domain-containing protein, partial [Clostridiales bacterium]
DSTTADYNYKLKNVINGVSQYKITNNFILDYYIYIKNSNSIIANRSLYKNELFYDRVFKYDDMDFESWNKILLENSYNGDFFPSKKCKLMKEGDSLFGETKVISYLRSIPIEYSKPPTGTIIVLLNEKEIHKFFNKLIVDDKSWAYISDKEGNIITSINSNNDSFTVLNDKMSDKEGFMDDKLVDDNVLISYSTSEYNDWIYTVAVSNDVAMSKLIYIKKVTILIVLIDILIGLIIALIFSYYDSRPVKKAFDLFKDFIDIEDEESSDKLSDLSGNVLKLIDNNTVLKESLDHQLPILKQTFFDRLFNNKFNNIDEIKSIMSYAGIKMEAKSYIVVIMHSYDKDILVNEKVVKELDLVKLLLKDSISNLLGDKGLSYDIDERKIAMIIYFYTDDTNICMQNTQMIIQSIYTKLLDQYNIKMFFSAGNLCSDILGLSTSYKEAREVTNINKDSTNSILFYKDVQSQFKSYYYPIDIEIKLINFLKTGETDKVKNLLDLIYTENFIKRKLHFKYLKIFISQLLGSLVRIENYIDIESIEKIKKETENFPKTLSFEKRYNKILNAYIEISKIINEQKTDKNKKLIDDIIYYINSSYADQNICLSSIASHFNITEGYLCHFFKDQLGEKFSNYLENLRMENAQIYLNTTTYSIEKISELVGYNSNQVFRRAFKRNMGITPKKYRENQELEVQNG